MRTIKIALTALFLAHSLNVDGLPNCGIGSLDKITWKSGSNLFSRQFSELA